MPDRFRSGEITNKYDAVTEPTIVSEVEEIKKKLTEVSDEHDRLSDSYLNFTTQYIDFYQTSLQHVPIVIGKVVNIESKLIIFKPYITAIVVLLNKILSSKIARFFNFFTHWYKVEKCITQDGKKEIKIIFEYGGEEYCLLDIISTLSHLFNSF